MIHPLLRLLATEPHLLGDHVEAYAELVGDELSKVSTGWAMRLGLYAAALVLVLIGFLLAGVALIVWGAASGSGPAPWLLFVVPLVPTVGGIACVVVAKMKTIENGFSNLKKQLSADMAMLREVSAS